MRTAGLFSSCMIIYKLFAYPEETNPSKNTESLWRVLAARLRVFSTFRRWESSEGEITWQAQPLEKLPASFPSFTYIICHTHLHRRAVISIPRQPAEFEGRNTSRRFPESVLWPPSIGGDIIGKRPVTRLWRRRPRELLTFHFVCST